MADPIILSGFQEQNVNGEYRYKGVRNNYPYYEKTPYYIIYYESYMPWSNSTGYYIIKDSAINGSVAITSPIYIKHSNNASDQNTWISVNNIDNGEQQSIKDKFDLTGQEEGKQAYRLQYTRLDSYSTKSMSTNDSNQSKRKDRLILDMQTLIKKEVMGKPNVVCVFPGTKTINGQDTGIKCIVVGVEKKIKKSDLKESHRIPEKLSSGTPTDVIVREKPFFLSSKKNQQKDIPVNPLPNTKRPITAGCEIGLCDFNQDCRTYGTLGLIVKDKTDNKLVGLTCNHVTSNIYNKNYATPIRKNYIILGLGKDSNTPTHTHYVFIDNELLSNFIKQYYNDIPKYFKEQDYVLLDIAETTYGIITNGIDLQARGISAHKHSAYLTMYLTNINDKNPRINIIITSLSNNHNKFIDDTPHTYQEWPNQQWIILPNLCNTKGIVNEQELNISQPSQEDPNTDQDYFIGKTKRAIPISYWFSQGLGAYDEDVGNMTESLSSELINPCDASIFSLNTASNSSSTSSLIEYGIPRTETLGTDGNEGTYRPTIFDWNRTKIQYGHEVSKIGATTDITYGFIRETNMALNVPIPISFESEYDFSNLELLDNETGEPVNFDSAVSTFYPLFSVAETLSNIIEEDHFADPGDSGSVVIGDSFEDQQTDTVLGLIIAKDNARGYACYIDEVANRLQIEPWSGDVFLPHTAFAAYHSKTYEFPPYIRIDADYYELSKKTQDPATHNSVDGWYDSDPTL